MGEEKWK